MDAALLPPVCYGRRDAYHERRRRWLLVLLVVLLVLLEGGYRWSRPAEGMRPDTWFSDVVYSEQGIAPPPKPAGVKRILYLSNSHGTTGGYVARHLQTLLEAAAPGGFQVLDFSEPGMFAPQMLLVGAGALVLQPDVALLQLSYINFADRMTLAQQNQGARRFLRPHIRAQLPFGFWWRNYDVKVFGNAWAEHLLTLYRHRLRWSSAWRAPLADWLGRLTGGGPPQLLGASEKVSFAMPLGFLPTFFDWRMYTTGRQNHLGDLADLLDLLRGGGVRVMAANLPIHWEKGEYPHQAEDAERFRAELAGLFRAGEYVDLQEGFPHDFTTYDPLHPHWHGARLHALQAALRLLEQGDLPGLDAERLVTLWRELERDTRTDYARRLGDTAIPYGGNLRYDLFDPQAAQNLLRRLGHFAPGTAAEARFLTSLSHRLRYWREGRFDGLAPEAGTAWQRAVNEEVAEARLRASLFQEQLTERLRDSRRRFPLPGEPEAERCQVATAATWDNRPWGYRLICPKRSYQRVDILGNGAFLLAAEGAAPLTPPYWVEHPDTLHVTWGVRF